MAQTLNKSVYRINLYEENSNLESNFFSKKSNPKYGFHPKKILQDITNRLNLTTASSSICDSTKISSNIGGSPKNSSSIHVPQIVQKTLNSSFNQSSKPRNKEFLTNLKERLRSNSNLSKKADQMLLHNLQTNDSYSKIELLRRKKNHSANKNQLSVGEKTKFINKNNLIADQNQTLVGGNNNSFFEFSPINSDKYASKSKDISENKQSSEILNQLRNHIRELELQHKEKGTEVIRLNLIVKELQYKLQRYQINKH